MKNILNFINERLKVAAKQAQKLPTWKEFTEALDNFPEKTVDLVDFCEELKDAEIKDYPTFINHGIERYSENGHIMELHADYDTKRNQSIIIYYKYSSPFQAFSTIRMYANECEVLVDSLGEDLYIEIYS